MCFGCDIIISLVANSRWPTSNAKWIVFGAVLFCWFGVGDLRLCSYAFAWAEGLRSDLGRKLVLWSMGNLVTYCEYGVWFGEAEFGELFFTIVGPIRDWVFWFSNYLFLKFHHFLFHWKKDCMDSLQGLK